MTNKRLVVGTRGSRLALIQTNLVVTALHEKFPDLNVVTKIIVTKGDKNLSPIPLDTIGKTWFTEEIETALSARVIDFAVHSLKDLPPDLPQGLVSLPVLKRDDPRDVLVAKNVGSLKDLPKGAIVGTDSIRRRAQLLHHRSDLIVTSVRGNVETRLEKLHSDNYDAIVLASAGLSRLGLSDKITQYFSPSEFVPATGQAVLAAEFRQEDNKIRDILLALQDENTVLSCRAEQLFSSIIGGGCKLPVGCYVEVKNTKVNIFGTVGSMDAKNTVLKSVSGPKSDILKLIESLANELLADGVRAGWQ